MSTALRAINRRIKVALALVTGAMILASCGNSGVLDAAQSHQLIAAAEAQTPIPSGSHYDRARFHTSPNAAYQQGYFLVVAEAEAQCKWYMYWLHALSSNDAGQMARADKVFDEMQSWPLYTATDPATRSFFESLAADAKLGDPTALQQFVTQNCSGISP